jgi:cysteine desulfurase family protein
MPSVYLDNAATTFPKPEEVYRAVDHFNRNLGGNPGRGSNKATLQAGSILMDCREALADLFNIRDSAHIAFTLNITEAINIALKGLLKPGDHVISSSMEHNSIARPLYAMEQCFGIEWTKVPCARDGSLDPNEVRKAIQPNSKMICILHASNLTGTIMPIEEIGKIAREHELLFVLDTAQTAGLIPIDVEKQYVDVLAFTGHKGLLGPQGTGGIYLKPGLEIKSFKQGGTGSLSESLEHPAFMPDLLESGTPNTPGIAGLLAGIQYIKQEGMDKIHQHEQRLCRMLMDGLQAIPQVELYGPDEIRRKTAVVSFNIKGMDCGELRMGLDHYYGRVSRSGLHCAPLAHQTIGSYDIGACRLSPGYFNREEDIALAIRAVDELASKYA